jgi:hypothetical protein
VTGKVEAGRIRKWSTQILNYINAMNLCIKKLEQKIPQENYNPTLPLKASIYTKSKVEF